MVYCDTNAEHGTEIVKASSVLHVRVADEIAQKIAGHAAITGRSISDLLREAVTSFVATLPQCV